MSASLNIDQLMMDALDERISAQDRGTLDAYLFQHPAERAVFERMQRVDGALCDEPSAPVPQTLKLNVMAALPRAAVSQSANAQPHLWLTAPQAVFIGMVAAMLVVLIGFGALALISTATPALSLPQSASPATAAIVNSVGNVADAVLHASSALIRAVLSQPIIWVVLVVSLLIASLWARLVVILLLPTLRFVLA